MSTVGSLATELGCLRHVRFTSGSDGIADITEWQFRANGRRSGLADKAANLRRTVPVTSFRQQNNIDLRQPCHGNSVTHLS